MRLPLQEQRILLLVLRSKMRLPLQEQRILLLVLRSKMSAMHAMLNSLHSMCLLHGAMPNTLCRILLLVYTNVKKHCLRLFSAI